MSVDLPMPGSPPINTNDPGTIPPPKTRFNSASCVTILVSLPASTSSIFTGLFCLCLKVSCLHSFLFASCFCMTSSTSEFHVPHDGHLPCHLADSWPHCWQKKDVFVLAIL